MRRKKFNKLETISLTIRVISLIQRGIQDQDHFKATESPEKNKNLEAEHEKEEQQGNIKVIL